MELTYGRHLAVTRGEASLLLTSIWSSYLHNCCLKWSLGPSPPWDRWSKTLLPFMLALLDITCQPPQTIVLGLGKLPQCSKYNRKKGLCYQIFLFQSFKWSTNLGTDSKKASKKKKTTLVNQQTSSWLTTLLLLVVKNEHFREMGFDWEMKLNVSVQERGKGGLKDKRKY